MKENKSQFRFNLPKSLHQQVAEKAYQSRDNIAALLRAYLEAYVATQPRNNAPEAA